MLKTILKFTWIDSLNEEKKEHLLSPIDVVNFYDLLNKGLSIDYVFKRVTKKDIRFKYGIKLIFESSLEN